MPRLTEEQRHRAMKDVREGMPFEDFLLKYKGTRSQWIDYGGQRRKSKLMEQRLAEESQVCDISEDGEEITQEINKEEGEKMKNEIKPINVPDEPETEINEEEETQEEIQRPIQDNLKVLDSNKDYCGECFENGRVTEVQKGQTFCLVCGVALQWQQ